MLSAVHIFPEAPIRAIILAGEEADDTGPNLLKEGGVASLQIEEASKLQGREQVQFAVRWANEMPLKHL